MKDLNLTAAAVAIVIAATLVSPFGRDLTVGDETKYGQVVREMRATGAWFLPALNGAPFTHKPPLHFWLIDLLTVPFGVYSTWAFVLPSIAAFVFLLWIVGRMGGPLAAFLCGTSLMVWVSAQSARMDVSFTAFLTLAIWMLWRFFEDDDQQALLLSGVWLGVATLIKGPMAPVIAVVLFLFECWRRRAVPRAKYWPAIAAMVVIPMAWFVPAVMLGGSGYAHEVIVKQTVGRAIASWVHRAPPWFYLLHLPGSLFPWFLAALAAIRGANRFYLSWIAAVLVPYSLMSSKLDVYMMAMIPPVALMIADAVERRSIHMANLVTLILIAIAGMVGAFFVPHEFVPAMVILAATALVGIMVSRKPVLSALALGLTPIVVFVYAAFALMPLLNDQATTQPLITALQKQNVAPERIALYSSPYLWSRHFPRQLERVRYVDADNIGDPTIIATSRAHANEIASSLRGYQRVDQVRMIGKWFDVYRR
jgi:4-amino-4-deoxy-L-arabinose transferase-like glycosyltransferase